MILVFADEMAFNVDVRSIACELFLDVIPGKTAVGASA
jgi:hypothetical protein